MPKFFHASLGALAVAAALVGPTTARAAIIDHPDVGGFRTFQDQTTGRVWLDLDNFFQMSVNQMLAAISGTGFSWATLSDVTALTATLPLAAGAWDTYAPIMGSAPYRPLIWGGLNDGRPNENTWGWASDASVSWNYSASSFDNNSITYNEDPLYRDMNLWAFQTGTVSAVPAPAAVGLLGLGLLALGAFRRRRA